MKKFLIPFLSIYQKISQLKNFLYDSKFLKIEKINIPVLSVGNLSFGGTGKTPVTISLAKNLINEGFKVAILLRGYKGKLEKKGGVVSNGKNILCDWQEAGDEAFLIAKNIPEAGVFVGKNRITQSQKAIQLGFNLIVLDDGFQYRALARDVDLVIISSNNLIWLREPLSSLKRANIVLLHHEVNNEILKEIRKFNSLLYISKFSFQKIGFYKIKENSYYSIKDFKSKKAIVFCGIANPLRFRKFIEELNVDIKYFISFPDHYSYPKKSVEHLVKKHKELKTEILITTEKDALKLSDYSDLPIYYLKIKAQLSKDLISYILQKIKTNASN